MTEYKATPGRIRKLRRSEAATLMGFYLALDSETRRSRFHGAVGDDFLRRHVLSLVASGIAFGCFVDGRLVGVGELFTGRGSSRAIGEAAFVVEPALRRQGIAGRLTVAVLRAAANRGCRSVKIVSLRTNWAMRKIAANTAAALCISCDEIEGTIAVPPPTPLSLFRESAADLEATLSAAATALLRPLAPGRRA